MQADREMLMLAYALHRAFLAEVLGSQPASVPLRRDEAGRPRIEGDAVWTSLSHTRGWVALAACRSHPVGVDIEPIERADVMDEIAHVVCDPDELERLRSLDLAARRDRLLSLWVRKEAVLKAVGVGLQTPMDSFCALDDRPVLIPGVGGRWYISSIEAPTDIRAAVAASAVLQVEGGLLNTSALFSRYRDNDVAADDS
ncbi:4'-phosphopantetheinyl transferase family protein [Lysobacter korlensis]|uniref:4'-phosphopantetheinyl transferase family protein n=2 Tax=Lysobacter korlensis TaxID=553636 RepID=A0ABV6RQP5_9GAMM